MGVSGMKKIRYHHICIAFEVLCIVLALNPYARCFNYGGASYQYASYIKAFGLNTIDAICFGLMVINLMASIFYGIHPKRFITVTKKEAIGVAVVSELAFVLSLIIQKEGIKITLTQLFIALLMLAVIILRAIEKTD